MKPISFYFVLLSLLFFTACHSDPDFPVSPSLGPIEKHYISTYVDVDSIVFDFNKNWHKKDSLALLVGTYGEEHRQFGEEKDIHSKYATLYGDTSFNQPAAMSGFSGGAILDTVKLSILCDKPYNGTHLAGTDINHLLEVRYFSAKEAIQNNYFKDKYKYLGAIPYKLRLDSLNMRENYLLGTSFALSFLEAPDSSGEYTFTLVYEGNSGKRIEKQTGPVYLEGKN